MKGKLSGLVGQSRVNNRIVDPDLGGRKTLQVTRPNTRSTESLSSFSKSSLEGKEILSKNRFSGNCGYDLANKGKIT